MSRISKLEDRFLNLIKSINKDLPRALKLKALMEKYHPRMHRRIDIEIGYDGVVEITEVEGKTASGWYTVEKYESELARVVIATLKEDL